MLTWSWKQKDGYLKVRQGDREGTVNLYHGNALLIALIEWKENGTDMYAPYTFWCDKTHAENCLGLNKGSTYCFFEVREVHLFAGNPNLVKLVGLFSKAINKGADLTLVVEKNPEGIEGEK